MRLAGRPDGTPAERRQFQCSYARTHAEAEERLAEAASPRVLNATEQWGAAGVWAQQQTMPPLEEPDDADACRAVLQAAADLGMTSAIPREAISLTDEQIIQRVLRAAGAVEATP